MTQEFTARNFILVRLRKHFVTEFEEWKRNMQRRIPDAEVPSCARDAVAEIHQ